MLSPFEMFLMIVGVTMMTGTYSYVLFPDNRWFKFNESLFIGGTAALGIYNVYDSLSGSIFTPLSEGRYTLIVPTLIGIAVFSRLTKYRWLARYATAILSGVGLGITLPKIMNTQILQNIIDTASFTVRGVAGDYTFGIIVVFGALCTIFYFTYSRFYATRLHEGRYRLLVQIGLVFMYIQFGTLYARDIVIDGFGTITSYTGIYFRGLLEEFEIFLREGGTALASQILIAALAVTLVPLIAHYIYTDVLRKKPTVKTPAA